MPDLHLIPPGYPELLDSLKERIRMSQVRAALAVNRELVLLYWSVGWDILAVKGPKGGEQESSTGWPRTSSQPSGVEGFISRNLKCMRDLGWRQNIPSVQ